MPRFPYIFFDNFVVRVPLLSYKEFQNICSESTNDEKLKEIFTGNLFKESIYLASSELYQEMEKSINNDADFHKDIKNKLRNTLLKYFNRIHNRCTPFGLFSGVGIGNFYSKSSLPKSYFEWQKSRETKIDMNFLVSLSQYITSIPDIRNQLLFSPNNSIYRIGNKIRYIEHAIQGMEREYIISSAPISSELEQVLDFSKQGKTILEIAELLKNDEISFDEIFEYLDELIENQVLVSELEPSVSGEDFLDNIISFLSRIDESKKRNILHTIRSKINQLDDNFENPVSSYIEIENIIENLNVKYEQQYLFQTDLYLDNQVKLSHHWKKELKVGISFLNKITMFNSRDTHLEKFKTAFYERFENEEILLAYALDTEVGIGYRQDIRNKGIHPYLEDLDLPISNERRSLEIKLNAVQIILNKKLQEAFLEKKYCITLFDEDFPELKENWKDLPNTMSFMGEVISEENHEKLYLNGGSGNAGRLLARFSSEKSAINMLIKEISEKEKELNPEKILAEIIHLPEARTGNILRRSRIREYEIPYLAKSTLLEENQISVDDLFLSVKNDRLVLRSKLHNREVVPCLTNAHNYSTNSLPVYHFLCDFGNQNIRSGLYFDWESLSTIYNFLPRVEYRNIILFKARWKISSDEINWFLSLLQTSNKESIMNKIENWSAIRQIPEWIQWIKSDNTLVINFKNWDLVHLFFSSVKNQKEIFIEEFLCNKDENFTSQFIFPMYKDLD